MLKDQKETMGMKDDRNVNEKNQRNIAIRRRRRGRIKSAKRRLDSFEWREPRPSKEASNNNQNEGEVRQRNRKRRV